MRMLWIAGTLAMLLGCGAGAQGAQPGSPPANSSPTGSARPTEAPPNELADAAPSARERQLEAKVEELERRLDAVQAQLDKSPPPQPSRPRRVRPDPAKVYAVPLDDSPAIGPRIAPVTMVAALQFPEPYTHRVWPTLMALRKEYRKDLRIVVKNYVVHQKHTASSIGACAAAYQGGLDPIEAAIYDAAQQPPPTGAPAAGLRELDAVEVREIARVLRLDLRRFDRDVALCSAAQVRDQAVLTGLGQTGVPAFWINGRPLSGAQPIESFRALIDEERAKAKADRDRGGKPASYYDRILRTGATAP